MPILAKANCRTGKELTKNISPATASLEFKFGVTNGLTIRNSSGKIEDGNYSSNEIADIFSNNGRVMRCLMDWVKQFDMQDAIMIPKLMDKTLPANIGKWTGPLIFLRMLRLSLSMRSRNMHRTSSNSTRLMELAIKTSIGC
jgi:hypothetical protein